MKIEVILNASLIPEDSTVRKTGGTYRYIIKKEFNVRGQIIAPYRYERFLVDDRFNITALSGDTELVWITDVNTLKQYLEERFPEDDY